MGLGLVDQGLVGGVVALLGLGQGGVGAGDEAVHQGAVVGVEPVVAGDLQVAGQRGQVGGGRAGDHPLGEDVAADDLGVADRRQGAELHRLVGRAEVGLGAVDLHIDLAAGVAIDLGRTHAVEVGHIGRGVGVSDHGDQAVERIARRAGHRGDQVAIAVIGDRDRPQLVAGVGDLQHRLCAGGRDLGLLLAEQVADQRAEHEADEGADAGGDQVESHRRGFDAKLGRDCRANRANRDGSPRADRRADGRKRNAGLGLGRHHHRSQLRAQKRAYSIGEQARQLGGRGCHLPRNGIDNFLGGESFEDLRRS